MKPEAQTRKDEARSTAGERRPDRDIARDAVEAVKRQLPLSHRDIKVIVRDGWATLEGEAESGYQKARAEAAVRSVSSVKGVINTLPLKPEATPTEIKRKVEEALKQHAALDADNIEVEAADGEVILTGTVHSWFEREEAERAAWQARGVKKVNDRIAVRP